ncbi:MAG: PA2778 family cysteine peptidase, partial [Burkholderiaceae bacterium]
MIGTHASRAHRNPALAGFVVCAALLLGGCAGTPQLQRLERNGFAGLPSRAQLSDVPFIAQDDYECGPAALAMLLQAAGVQARAAELKPQVFLPGRRGSLQLELLVAARRHGLPAYRLAPSLQALLTEIAAGHPVLVFENLSLPIYPVWHYAVVIGYDRERGTLRLHSGRTAEMEMSLSTFERTWARGDSWAMVALPVDQLPATAEAA